VLPLDTVDTTERNAIPKYALRNGTIRLPEWQEGRPINTTVSVPVANRLDEPRLFRLDWHVPYGADVQVEPEGLWLEVPAKETKEVSFRISSSSAPEEEHRPWLELSSENKLRTGVVSREWEQKYRDEAESAEFPTNIELDAPITYTSKLQIFKPPVAIALPRTGDITIDGKFTEEAWFKAPPINDFRNANEAEPDVDTGIRLLYDDNFLYVAAVMEEPNPENMTNTATGDIALTWSDDDLELFFDPKMSESDYWRLFQNSFGTRFSSKPRDVENKYFDSAYESAIETGDDYWTLEMAIPWRDIDVKAAPKAGDRWGFNIGRHRQQSEPAQIQWSSMHGEGLYNPTRYGILQFQ
jgi:hypothetical protein